ncbi:MULTISPECIES: M23 family metallopeptidase [Aquimarina]|uniref:M23 family metallopeptidase n=1 Tax=Aquimarina TaxID=290174 RepID=UPI000D689AB6|nr:MULTISPECIES: M23 family metallopeptidase [Aquimarina]
MKIPLVIVIVILSSFLSCKNETKSYSVTQNINKKTNPALVQNQYQKYDTLFKKNPDWIASDFEYPVGKPNAKGYYNAQKFKENNHLGDDWNGVGGGNTDLGDPIYAIGNGYVSFAKDIKGGWGNVIRIIHKYKGKYYESVYAHCDTIHIEEGDFVKKGTLIGTIGNAHGIYWAHLHLEIRDDIFMDIGGGYSEETSGYLDPTEFININ